MARPEALYAVRTAPEVLGAHPAGLGPSSLELGAKPLPPGEIRSLVAEAPESARGVLDRLVWGPPVGVVNRDAPGSDGRALAAGPAAPPRGHAHGDRAGSGRERDAGAAAPRGGAAAARWTAARGGRPHSARRRDHLDRDRPGRRRRGRRGQRPARPRGGGHRALGARPTSGAAHRRPGRPGPAAPVRVARRRLDAGRLAGRGHVRRRPGRGRRRGRPGLGADAGRGRVAARTGRVPVGAARGRLAHVHPRRSPGRRPARRSVVTGERPRLGPALAARFARCAPTSSRSWPASRPGDVATSDSLLARLRWRRPMRNPARLGDALTAVLREAEWLGVTGRGGLSTAGRALVAGDEVDAVAATMASQLPEPVDHVLVQADLTAIAPGPLHGDLAQLMRLTADVESRGGATVYRFTPGVRAAGPRRRVDRRRAARRPPRRQPDRAPPAPRVPRPRRRPPPRSDPGRGRDRIHPERRRVGPGGTARRALAGGTAAAAHRADRARLLRRPRDAARADARRRVLAGAGAPGRLGRRLGRRPPPGRRPPGGVTAADDAGGRGVCVEPGPRPARG